MKAGEVARAFQGALVDRLLGAVWDTYDVLLADAYSLVPDWDEDLRDLERDLVQEFEIELTERVRHLSGGYLPVRVQHERREHTTQRSNTGQPPAYDIAFVWEDDTRIVWPLEAKALRDDQDTAAGPGEYVENGVRRYLDRTYAPFVLSGGMLAFLRSGSPGTFALHVEARLRVSLHPYASFPGRKHWTSDHIRLDATGASTEPFTCHHMVLELRP